MTKKIKISKKELKELYEKESLSSFNIADRLGCCQATVWKRMKEFKIKPRESGVKRVKVSKKILYDLYVIKKLSNWKIGEELSIPRSTVYRKLKNYGMIKDRATAHIIYPRKDFSKDPIEQAYLIGFRIGDLRVRKQYLNSKTICVACGTTIPEQVELLKQLFEDYGRVWIKETPKGKINIEIFLNESFDFLLSKEVPNWILNEKVQFFSFLAGFIDAEGSFGIYKNRALFQIGNYDSNLLFLICKKLNEYGIPCNYPLSDKRKGKKNNEGYSYNQDYWSFRISKKESLRGLLFNIQPFIKHPKKVKALKTAIENIIHRSNKKK